MKQPRSHTICGGAVDVNYPYEEVVESHWWRCGVRDYRVLLDDKLWQCQIMRQPDLKQDFGRGGRRYGWLCISFDPIGQSMTECLSFNSAWRPTRDYSTFCATLDSSPKRRQLLLGLRLVIFAHSSLCSSKAFGGIVSSLVSYITHTAGKPDRCVSVIRGIGEARPSWTSDA